MIKFVQTHCVCRCNALVWLVVLLVVAGCDRVFDLQAVGPVRNDASAIDSAGSGTSDASRSDAQSPIDAPTDAPTDAPMMCPISYVPLGYVPLGSHNTSYRLVNVAAAFPTGRGICDMDEIGITRHTQRVVLDDETERVMLVSSFGAICGPGSCGSRSTHGPRPDDRLPFLG